MNLTEKIAYLEKKMDSNKFDIEYYGKKETLALLEISILNDNFKARTLNEKREDLSDLNIKDESQTFLFSQSLSEILSVFGDLKFIGHDE